MGICASPTFTTESSGWNFLFAFLKGSETCFTLSTMSRPESSSSSSLLMSPITPIIVV